MGRVSKYKKIKAFDPFAKRSTKERSGLLSSGETLDSRRQASLRKRKRRARRNPDKDDFDGGFDAPPQEEDDFDINDPSLGIKNTQKRTKLDHGLHTKTENNALSKELTCHIPETDKEEARVARVLRIGKQNGPDKSNDSLKRPMEGRKDGESMQAFKKRVDREMRHTLMEEALKESKNTSKSEKNKAYLKKKKKMKKACKKSQQQIYNCDDDENVNDSTDNGVVTGERAAAIIGLTEQAERPPTFTSLPRGAKLKVKTAPTGDASGNSFMDDKQQERERRAMEMMRNKVQAAYALMKEKRKKKGNFHV